MKKTLHLFRARWLLMAVMLLGVLGAHAQDTWYIFDSFVADGEARATLANPDSDGNYVVEFDPSVAQGRTNFVFVNSPNPNTDAQTARFLGATATKCSVTAPMQSGLKEIDYDTAYGDKNIFEIESPWMVTFNPTAMTVKFEIIVPKTLYLCSWNKCFAEAQNDGNGVFRFENFTVSEMDYPHYGFTNDSRPNAATMVLGTVPYAEASKDNNLVVTTKGASGTWDFSQYDCINMEIGSFEIPAGLAFDCVLDWNAKTVEFTRPEIKAPEMLYLVDYEKEYGSAVNNGDGVFVFENVVPSSQYPYYGFSPISNPKTAEWVLGTVDYGTASGGGAHAYNINVEYGREYTYEFSMGQAMYDEIGSFVLTDLAVDIILDWNKGTVVFNDRPVPAPDNLWLVDFNSQFATAANNGNGIYRFEAVSVPDNGYPYYGFANNANPRAADVIVSAVAASQATSANNVEVAYGGEYPVEMSTWSNIDAMIGSYIIYAGTYDITLNWETKKVKFDKSVIPAPSALYATDTFLEDVMGAASNDGSGVFNMVVNVDKSNALVVFTNSADLKNAEGETLYYGTSDGPVSGVEFEQEYGLGKSDYNTVWGDATGLRLAKGRYKMDIDFNQGTIIVHDISRGDVWVIPGLLNMYTDEMAQVAQGSLAEDGVFKFDNVAIDKPANVVFTDNPTSSGKFFGSSMNGDRSVKVKNFRTYDLYIPTYQEIVVDGLAGFEIPAGTWSVTVDMNEKTVKFTDPESVYYPEKLNAVIDNASTSNVAEGSSSYVWKLDLAKESSLTFADPLTGRVYGSPTDGVTVAAGAEYDASELAPDALYGYSVPAGVWEVVLDLAKGKAAFYEYEAISLVESTMNDGDKFYSYFGAGTDPKLTLTFTGNPYTVESAILALGDYTPGTTKDTPTCKIEKISIYREGNTLFTSFAGKERTLPEGAQAKATLVLTSIKSVHGLLIEAESIEGLPAGSLMFTYDFEQFQPVAIESKLLDAAGQPVAETDTLNVDEIEDLTILVKPYSLITFDGVALQPAGGSGAEAVALEWEAGEEDAEGFTPVVAKMPMGVRGTGKWTLTLANLNADDLTEHGSEACFGIETLVHPADVVASDPENGSKVDELQDVTLAWNHSLVQSAGYSGTVEPEVMVTDEAGTVYPAVLQVLSTLDDNELLLHLADRIVAAGKYTVEIPAGTIVINDDKDTNAKAIVLAYEVSGALLSIESVIASNPDAEVVVCTVSGVVLRRGRAAEVLKDLRQGIYIINGVKTHIR